MTQNIPKTLPKLFKQNGFDGIVFRSSLADGKNVVLFDVEGLNRLEIPMPLMAVRLAGTQMPKGTVKRRGKNAGK